MTRDEIVRALWGHVRSSVPVGGARRAAVLVPLRPMEDPDALEVVLTRRAAHLGSHAGQVSFPGGAVEPGDEGPVDTALRETHEELGVPPHRVEVIGPLLEMVTVTGFHVVQVAGLLPREISLIPNPNEVARVFSVPVDVLLDPGSWERQVHAYRGQEFRIWHVRYDGEDIWGATASMLRQVIEILRPSAVVSG